MKFVNMSVEELHGLGTSKHRQYIEGSPFPNIYFDNFFSEEMLNQVLEEFPDLQKKPDIDYDEPYQVKKATQGEYNFGETTTAFAHFLNSQTFLQFLTNLTGIDHLLSDPYFEGGGFHQIPSGGFLKIHADFNKHRWTKLDRRLNVLIYLNKDWNEAWGGHFELWDKKMKGCQQKIAPLFNRMAIFSTTDFSYHGHPDALQCPPERSRKSFALYYYTNGRPAEEINQGLEDHSTIFKARPGRNEKKIINPVSAKDVMRELTPPVLWKVIKKVIN